MHLNEGRCLAFFVSRRRGKELRKRPASRWDKPSGRRSRFAQAPGMPVPQDIALAGSAGAVLVLMAALPSPSCQAFTVGRPAGGR